MHVEKQLANKTQASWHHTVAFLLLALLFRHNKERKARAGVEWVGEMRGTVGLSQRPPDVLDQQFSFSLLGNSLTPVTSGD